MTSKEFEDKEREILKRVPPEFHGAISYYAYQHGHGCGMNDVLIYAEELVDALEGAIEKFAASIKNGM
jgi:hypothetical protein